MSKRLYLLILFAVTLFCGCKNSNPLDSTTKVSFSIPARVLEDVGNNNGEDILVCTQVLRGSKVIIDEKYERTLFFDENNKPCIESIVLENIPLYTSLVFKIQILVENDVYAEGQSKKTLFTEGKNTLNLQLKLIPKDDDEDDDPEPEDPADPEIELKIDQTSITVEEWEENATFTATEGFDSYSWICGEQTGTENEFIIDVSKLKVGEYDVVVTAKKGTKEYTATAKLKVEELSIVLIINQSEITVSEKDEKATFTATEGFDSYSWICGEQTGTENEFIIDVSKLKVGEYDVVVTAKKGTKEYTATAKLKVEELSIVLIINQSEITVSEKDEKATFTATEGFDSYNWTCGEQTGTGNEFIIDITKLKVGEYDVVVTAKKGTKEYTVTAKLKVEAFVTLVINQSEITVNETEEKATFTATEGFDSYNWSCGEQTGTGSEFAIDITKLKVGEYDVTLKATKDGKEYEAVAKLKVEELSIVLQISEKNVTVEEWKESTEFTATEGFESYTWEVVDTNTNETKLSQTGEKNKFVIDISQLPVGKYNVSVTAVKGTKTYTTTTTLEVIAFATVLQIQQGNVVIGEGKQNITFTATSGYTNYSWTCDGEELIGEESSITIDISTLSVGEHEIKVTAIKGTITHSVSTTLTVNTPSITLQIEQSDVIVENTAGTTTFTATEGFDSYNWTCGDQTQTGSKSSFTIVKTSLREGVYIVRLIATKDGIEYSAETSLTVVKPNGSSGISFEVVYTDITIAVEEDDTDILFATDFGYDSYKWIIAGKDDYDNSPCCSISKDSLGEGVYIVRLIATKDGREYSAEGKLTVDLPNGPSGFSIDVVENADIYFDVEFSSDYSKITFVTYENCDSYYWTCGNKSGNEKTFTIEKSDFDVRATYLIRLVVYKDGREYSCEQLFSISE